MQKMMLIIQNNDLESVMMNLISLVVIIVNMMRSTID